MRADMPVLFVRCTAGNGAVRLRCAAPMEDLRSGSSVPAAK